MPAASIERGPPPALEGGWGWVVLVASFLSFVLVSGYMLSLSVFVVEWQLYFEADARTAGFVGVIMGFVGPVSGLPAGGLSKTFGCRTVVMIGGLLLSLSFLLASFATELYHLYLTTILTGVGTGFHYQPAVMIISFYFHERLGLANGIAMSGVGIGMLVMPPFYQYLIDRYTWQKTYLILAALNLSVVLVGIIFRPSDRELYFLKNRTKHKPLPVEDTPAKTTANTGQKRPTKSRRKSVSDTSYTYMWHSIKFLGFQLIWQNPSINLSFLAYGLLGMGFYSSLVFFTSKAVFDLGIEPDTAAWLVSLVGIGSFSARATHGLLIDWKIISPTMLYVLSAMACCLSSVVNPFTTSFGGLAACAVVLGMGSGISISITVVCLRQCLHPSLVSNAWGICLMFFGCGNLVGTYLMAFLYDVTESFNISFFVSAGAFFVSSSLIFILHLARAAQKRREQQGEQEGMDTKNDPQTDAEGNIGGALVLEHDPWKEELELEDIMKK